MRALHKPRAEVGARRLTAEEIRTARFDQAPRAWRGCSEEEVTAFLARVATSVETDEAERAALRAEVDRLRHYYRSRGEDVDATPYVRPYRPPPTAGDLTSQVRQRLDAIGGNAEVYADLITPGTYRLPDDQGGPEQAREVLAHAEVAGRIGFEETVDVFRSLFRSQPAAVTAELRRTLAWLDEYAHAVGRQVGAMQAALSDRLDGAPEAY
jgi:DivIVA domain-containing protein